MGLPPCFRLAEMMFVNVFVICVLKIHFPQANIKPEPEESWFNMRRNQEYNAMRGMLSVIQFDLSVKLLIFLFLCFQIIMNLR